jgi:hypothetical protein
MTTAQKKKEQRDYEKGWGKDNEYFLEIWPMDIPEDRLPEIHPNDPLDLPLRVAKSGLLHNPISTKE